MTELYINNVPIILPESLSSQLISENPLFTENGEYTLNIRISLLIPENQKVYGHLNRLHSLTAIPEKRSVMLIVDNEVFSGTETILNIYNDSVEIQILIGNSELNYLVTLETKIRDLNLGSATVNPSTVVSDALEKTYPAVDWLILPFLFNESKGLIGNRYGIYWDKSYAHVEYAYTGDYFPEDYRPQPFFCAILRKIMNALGYSIRTNDIESHPEFRYFYIVHGFRTMEYAKMLPDWTVGEFIQEVQKLFNCQFYVDRGRQVDIVFNGNFYNNVRTQELTVVEEYEIPIESEAAPSYLNSNMGYALGGDEYYVYGRLNKDVHRAATGTNNYSSMENLVTAVRSDQKRTAFYRYTGDDSLFIANLEKFPQKVDYFKNLMNNPNSESLDVEFKIMPAPMYAPVTIPNSLLQLPVVESHNGYPFLDDDSEVVAEYTLEGLIDGSETQEDPVNTSLRLASYKGPKEISYWGSGVTTGVLFPLPIVESLTDQIPYDGIVRDYNNGVNPFRLDYLYNQVYRYAPSINTTKIYKFSLLNPLAPIDTRAIFIINNKRFVCKQIERNFTPEGFAKVFEGEFYALD